MEFPPELQYSADHEWLRAEGDQAIIGITAFAAGELGDIVYLDVPATGHVLEAGAVFGSIEAVKTVSDLFMPVTGTIIAVNPLLADRPELVNSDPYGEGWLIRITRTEATAQLLDVDAYKKLIGHV